MRLTQKFLVTLPEELFAELERRRGLVKRNTYIKYLLETVLSIPPEQLEAYVSKELMEYIHGPPRTAPPK